ncbi:hypothetical protein HG536_0G02290 [Torulaspora globosa]|uniref:Uncharacterized protein n=1 Tax=Torulaspora globosa TaxID=48254 RepID=A0A7G3ZLI2_9SACH|nr:uncharacterized protein HG536_0G02290 [Torulaspora globosa]QLL34368.1 hypothetical protein HG536_0G02290 [Torulaspora globosa]
MDTVACLNRLRAQFLWDCPENEQMRRIIKPYMAGQEGSIDEVATLYIAPDGHDMLPEMESPPLSLTNMDGYLSKNRPLLANARHYSKSKELTKNARGEVSVARNKSNKDQKDVERERQSISAQNQARHSAFDTVTERRLPVSIKSDTTYRKHDSDSQTDSDEPEADDFKKKASRRLSISRIFKGRHESNGRKDNKKRRELQKKRRDINFDINFDYDEDLEEDDDEEEDEEGENLQSRFFQLDLESSKSSHANGDEDKDPGLNRPNSSTTGFSSRANNVAPGTSATLSANNRKSHFPQNIMPRASLVDGGRNGSLRSDRLQRVNGHENAIIGDQKDNRTAVEGEEYGSDLESYINEQDLDNLDLDGEALTDDNDNFSKVNLRLSSTNKNVENQEEGSVPNGDHRSSSGSSYGRSLLDSDFSGSNFMKKESSAIDSTSFLDDSDMQPATMSHSIPMTLEDYGIYHGQDDSTLNNVFDEAVMNMKKSSRTQLRERRSSNCLISHSLGSTRHSSSSNTGIKGKGHTRSLSTASNDSSKVRSELEKKCALGPGGRQGKLNLPPSIYRNGSTPRGSSLVIQKITDFPKPDTSDSLLSSLFSRRKQAKASAADILEYFSFVSGNKVPRGEASTISVYIQSSAKYKRHPFEANIRNSATIFETIGYILYLFSTKFKPDKSEGDGLNEDEIKDPNKFCLKIVDEDGEPFEDDFGKIDRLKTIQSLSDNEVVLCKVSATEEKLNEKETPLPYDLHGEIIDNAQIHSGGNLRLNQFSYYKPILSDETNKKNENSKIISVKVYLFPCGNKEFNYTIVEVSVTSSLNDILVRYCKMKKMDPNEYLLKVPDKKVALNLNDTVLRLDGHHEVEVVSKREARELHLEKCRPDLAKPNLPTIQSTDLTPMTLDPSAYLKPESPTVTKVASLENKPSTKYRKAGSKHKLVLSTQISGSSNTSGSTVNAFFKAKNSSKASLHGSYYAPDHSTPVSGTMNTGGSNSNYPELLSGAYHKYKVWRRQQMSLMNKHERALALDGDYIYIVPPEKHLHWHENVKTKSIHISQVISVAKSKRVPEYFKLFIRRGQHDLKRYYFEAVSSQECMEIVSRIQNSLNAYKMNHK